MYSKTNSALNIKKKRLFLHIFYGFIGFKETPTESRKRTYKQIWQNKHKLSTEDKDQNQTKNPWGALSETWGLNDVVEDDFLPRNNRVDGQSHGRSIKDRLGIKSLNKDTTQTVESTEVGSSSDSEENWCKRSKVLRMRMHADDEEEKQQKRRAKLRYQVSLLFIETFILFNPIYFNILATM